MIDFFNQLMLDAPSLGYLTVFVLTLLESLVLVGLFIPGTLIVIFFGFLTYLGYFALWSIIPIILAGAILGDLISYYLGTRGVSFFHHENRFLKRGHLEKSQQFFVRHGDKSILLGRFMGVIRPFVSFVAGLSGMSKLRFVLWDVVASVAWTVTNILLGYFFGHAWRVVGAWTSSLGLIILGTVIILVLAWWAQRRYGSLWVGMTSGVQFIRRQLTAFPGTASSVLLFGNFIYVLSSYLKTVQNFWTTSWLWRLDHMFGWFLVSSRLPVLTEFLLVLTILGDWRVLIFLTVIVLLILRQTGLSLYIWPFVITNVGAGFSAWAQKVIVSRPRPDPTWAVYLEQSFSFPSAHSALAITFYGFLAYIIWHVRSSTRSRLIVLNLSIALILIIGFSRMYLGVHYLSDVLGGYFIGLLWLLVGVGLAKWFSKVLAR